MEIILTAEHAYYFIPQCSLEVARDRIEQKKTSLVAGTVGSLISRPKPEDIPLISIESRLEPFWLISASAHVSYERNRTYTVMVGGPEVQQVTALGQDLQVSSSGKAGACFSINGVEHCVEDRHVSSTFDGLSGEKVDMSRYLTYAKTEIADLENFAPQAVLVVPPQARANAVVRPVMADVIKPVQAQVIHEEYVKIEAIDLNFRPVYALEYEWTAKAKRVVFEFDALTGEFRTGGRKLSDQIKSILSRDLLFEVTADAAGLFVPGGSIAVKLVRAVVDHKK